MNGLAALGIWNDAAIHDALSWYLAVAENRRPTKFRIAATVPAELDLSTDILSKPSGTIECEYEDNQPQCRDLAVTCFAASFSPARTS
jgi:hypothetical protein